MYTYYLPFRHFFKKEDITTFKDWKSFRNQWNNTEPTIIILPVMSFDLIGLDVRYVFREFGRNDNVRFLLIGTTKQINFSLTQNESFLGNIIEELTLPHDFDTIEYAILKKIDRLEKQIKGRKK